MEGNGKGTVCVTGASGFLGSWLVMRLLERGYTVHATVRDPGDPNKVRHLLDLPHAEANLTLWKADLSDVGSFDEAVENCQGVFHVATPMDIDSNDPENEVIKPAIEGTLHVLRSCKKAGTVWRVVFTSTALSTCVHAPYDEDYCNYFYIRRTSLYDEDYWSDVDFCRTVKMNGWMHIVSKTLAEKAAWEFAEENGMDLISILPSLIHGPFIVNSMPRSIEIALALFTKSSHYYPILNPVNLVHIEDVCRAHIFLYEHPEAKGRFLCSNYDLTLTFLAEWLRMMYPESDIPTTFEGLEQVKHEIEFSDKKLTNLGFKFEKSAFDMYVDAIECCVEKGLMPLPAAKQSA